MKYHRIVSVDMVDNMGPRDEERLASRADSVHVILPTPYPYMDECRLRLLNIKRNTTVLIAADHLTNYLSVSDTNFGTARESCQP